MPFGINNAPGTFTIRTDHDSFRWILIMADATGKLARWRLYLAGMKFDVAHQAGIKHQAADALSRLETTGIDQTLPDDDLPLLALVVDGERAVTYTLDAHDGWINGSHGDSRISETINLVETKPTLPVEAVAPTLDEMLNAQSVDTFCMRRLNMVGSARTMFDINPDSFVVRRAPIDGSLQLIVSAALQQRMMKLIHDPFTAGHPGARRMYDTMRQQFY